MRSMFRVRMCWKNFHNDDLKIPNRRRVVCWEFYFKEKPSAMRESI